jgi:hypothetical protein
MANAIIINFLKKNLLQTRLPDKVNIWVRWQAKTIFDAEI